MFYPFEWMVAMRYLSRPKARGVYFSYCMVLAFGNRARGCHIDHCHVGNEWLSPGITLHILGVNGHLSVYGVERSLTNYDRLSGQVAKLRASLK